MADLAFIAENLKHIRERIAQAALRSGREPDQVKLVAVSKTFSPQAVVVAYHAGQRHFGENRPEEGAEKIPVVEASLGGSTLPTWHMIGHIQRRKAPLVIAHFDMVHSIDRTEVAARLSPLAQQAGCTMPALLECNVSGEASKSGYAVAGWENDSAVRLSFMDEVAAVMNLPGLEIRGLMTMAPLVDDVQVIRPVFASLRSLRDALREVFPDADFSQLSMGMSSDYEIAVEEGATMVRIGRALFGQRTV